MKVLTILGTRPEIIRLSRVIEKLDERCDHILVDTGQNHDEKLSQIFYEELGVRKPDYQLEARGSFGSQVGAILTGIEDILAREMPERFLVLGDTNSSLAAISAKRVGIPVYHMEAGNRCYDDRVPEEVNRRLIDHASDVLLPYTERSRQNLIREGIASNRIFVTGNPIFEVVKHYEDRIANSDVLEILGLVPGQYFLVTMHRAENVDIGPRLRSLTDALKLLHKELGLPIVISTHPRTQMRIKQFGLHPDNDHVRYLDPFGFFDFVHLEKHARCVLTDSGTVQEECAIFGIPNVTIRDVTERPETIESGSNMLSGASPDSIIRCVRTALDTGTHWAPPPEYLIQNVSQTVIKSVLAYRWGMFDF